MEEWILEIETKKTINKDKIAVNPIDHDTLEKTLAITDSVDDKNKNGFNQTYKDFKEYKIRLNNHPVIYRFNNNYYQNGNMLIGESKIISQLLYKQKKNHLN